MNKQVKPVSIHKISAQETYPLRKTELRKGMKLSHRMAGDEEVETLHLGLFEGERLVCIGSFMKASKDYFSGSQYQLRGMATASDRQGNGFGKLLLEKAEEMLKQKEIHTLWCNARTVALDFYKKQGYQIVGDEFLVPEVGPHYVMFKELK